MTKFALVLLVVFVATTCCMVSADPFLKKVGSKRPPAPHANAPTNATFPMQSPTVPTTTPLNVATPTAVAAPVPPLSSPAAAPIDAAAPSVPVDKAPTAPVPKCGLLRHGRMCIFTSCGLWGRMFGHCNDK